MVGSYGWFETFLYHDEFDPLQHFHQEGSHNRNPLRYTGYDLDNPVTSLLTFRIQFHCWQSCLYFLGKSPSEFASQPKVFLNRNNLNILNSLQCTDYGIPYVGYIGRFSDCHCQQVAEEGTYLCHQHSQTDTT